MYRSSSFPGAVPLLLLLIILNSCGSPGKELVTYKILDESLGQASETIQQQNHIIYAAIEERLKAYRHEASTRKWYASAMQIHQHSDELRRYIDSLKEELKNEASLKWSNGIDLFHEQDESVVDELFLYKGKGKALFDKLKQYKRTVLCIDSTMQQHLTGHLILTSSTYRCTEYDPETFTNTFFRSQTPVAALAMLSRLQNAVTIIENRLASYCLAQA